MAIKNNSYHLNATRDHFFRINIIVVATIILAAAATGTWQCKDNCVGQPGSPQQIAYVRFIHASPDAPPVDMLVNATPIVSGLAFNSYPPSTTGYRNVMVIGNDTLSVRYSGTTSAILLSTLHLTVGHYYTVVLIGKEANLQLMILNDTLNLPPADSARIRFIQAVPDMPTVNVTLAGKSVVQGLGFGHATQYLEFHSLFPPDTGSLYVLAGAAPNNTIFYLPSGKFAIIGNSVITILLLGEANPNGKEPIASATIFNDAGKSVNGYGDILLPPFIYGAIRVLNVLHPIDSVSLMIFQGQAVNGVLPAWRDDFPDQGFLFGIANSQTSEYLPLDTASFATDSKGNKYIGIQAFEKPFYFLPYALSDSSTIEPFFINNRYTVALVGDGTPPYPIVILQDTLPDPPQGKATIRFFNASPEPGRPSRFLFKAGVHSIQMSHLRRQRKICFSLLGIRRFQSRLQTGFLRIWTILFSRIRRIPLWQRGSKAILRSRSW